MLLGTNFSPYSQGGADDSAHWKQHRPLGPRNHRDSLFPLFHRHQCTPWALDNRLATCSAAMLIFGSRLQRRRDDRSRPGNQCSWPIRFQRRHCAPTFSRNTPASTGRPSGAAISPPKRFKGPPGCHQPSASAESGHRRPFCAPKPCLAPLQLGTAIGSRAANRLVGRRSATL